LSEQLPPLFRDQRRDNGLPRRDSRPNRQSRPPNRVDQAPSARSRPALRAHRPGPLIATGLSRPFVSAPPILRAA
jgi:hypothetical protein